MSVLTLRLPDQIESQLEFFAQREQSTKSALGREALEQFLAMKKREMELESMVQAVQSLNENPAYQAEMVEINQAFYPSDSENTERLNVAENEADWWK